MGAQDFAHLPDREEKVHMTCVNTFFGQKLHEYHESIHNFVLWEAGKNVCRMLNGTAYNNSV